MSATSKPDGTPLDLLAGEGVEPTSPLEPLQLLFQHLHAAPRGLTSREATRRLTTQGRNELAQQAGRPWWTELVRQLAHPLALLLWFAAMLAAVGGTFTLSIAIVAVIVLNAVFAFVQERQAERALDALEAYLPLRARAIRDGLRVEVDAAELVPGDVIVLEAGDRIPADSRLISGSLEVDLSMLTGESMPLLRSATYSDHGPLLRARDIVFSGTSAIEGDAQALVFATGMRTEIGRIAALSQHVVREESPLEHQIRRVAWLIAIVAVAAGLAFLPLGLVAGLPAADAVSFTIGLIVANVPEGLLPTITLALAIGVRSVARSGALVKRLSAIETLGSTTVICSDKTGTLTENRMRVVAAATPSTRLDDPLDVEHAAARVDAALHAFAEVGAACSNAELQPEGSHAGDPTEIALLEFADRLGADASPATRQRHRLRQFHFDPTLRLMSTVDDVAGERVVHVKGAPEDVLRRCSGWMSPAGQVTRIDAAKQTSILASIDAFEARGLRVLAAASRRLDPDEPLPTTREQCERDLCYLGVAAMLDPPRAAVPEAVARCRRAGIRIIIITGDSGRTTAEIARSIGIAETPRIVEGAELEGMDDARLEQLLREADELIFARSSPESKLRIADTLKDLGHVVAMTGDGVNDAPALRVADIGIAMGRSGTDVAREASTMVLTTDDFTSIVAAVEGGRRVYDNVRKFIVYIFAHAPPEVIPFFAFALSAGRIPLPITVLQILAIDLGTETLPALALGREPAEPGLMDRPPRPPSEGVIQRRMLTRAWGWMGLVSALLVFGAYLLELTRAGWTLGADVSVGSALHEDYVRATTISFAGIVACQLGTAIASRTDVASVRAVGLRSNRLLLWGIAFELAFAAALIYVPFLQPVFHTAALGPTELALLAPFPIIVWATDELRRRVEQRRRSRSPA